MWAQIKKNYVSRGIRAFWLDVAEPGYTRRIMNVTAIIRVHPWRLEIYIRLCI